MEPVPDGGDAGGSLALGELIDQHGPALAWDLGRAGFDLWEIVSDLCSDQPHRTPGYWLALIDWIPDDGTAVASMRGGRHWLGWTREAQVAADTWDLHAAVAVAQGGKKAMRKPPPTYPRPKQVARASRTLRKQVRRRLSDLPGAFDVRQFQQPPDGGSTSGG